MSRIIWPVDIFKKQKRHENIDFIGLIEHFHVSCTLKIPDNIGHFILIGILGMNLNNYIFKVVTLLFFLAGNAYGVASQQKLPSIKDTPLILNTVSSKEWEEIPLPYEANIQKYSSLESLGLGFFGCVEVYTGIVMLIDSYPHLTKLGSVLFFAEKNSGDAPLLIAAASYGYLGGSFLANGMANMSKAATGISFRQSRIVSFINSAVYFGLAALTAFTVLPHLNAFGSKDERALRQNVLLNIAGLSAFGVYNIYQGCRARPGFSVLRF
jgi:hypothetical protein